MRLPESPNLPHDAPGLVRQLTFLWRKLADWSRSLGMDNITDGQIPVWDGTNGQWLPGAAYSDENARDAIGAALVAGSNVTITVDDPGNTITIASTGGGSTPTGTGFRHVTAGTEDAATKLVSESDLSFTDVTTGNASTSAHGLLKKLPGNSAKYLDGTGNYTSPSATGGAGWQTALDLDFSAEASQTLSTDTNYTIGGLTWTKVNSTNDATAMAVTNGTGLVITPKSTGTYQGAGSRTAPHIYTDLATIIPAYYMEMPLRVWLYVSADNITAQGDAVGCAIDNMAATQGASCLYVFRRANNTGTKSLESNGAINGTIASFSANTAALDNSDRILQFSLPTGRWSGASALWAGADAAGWPSPAALRPVFRQASVTSSLAYTNDVVTGLPFKLVLFAQRNGSATALSCTIKRLRVDFQST